NSRPRGGTRRCPWPPVGRRARLRAEGRLTESASAANAVPFCSRSGASRESAVPIAARAAPTIGAERQHRIPMTPALKLGTRPSTLAVAQARLVADALCALEASNDAVELVTVETHGDRDLARPLTRAGADFFSGALDDALLAGRVDFCVHSLKDLP